jgi:NADH-quinone oxidoreductase subunit E
MIDLLENIPSTDPLAIPDQRALIDQILQDNQDRPGAAMVVLGELQGHIGFISEPMQSYVARKLHLPLSQVRGVVSFYSFFTTTPRGKHTVKLCLGTACYVSGAPQLLQKAEQELGIAVGSTTEDGQITLETCRCIGACSQAPAVTVDKDVFGRVQPNTLPQILSKYRKK